jgi:hypothetical protein
MVTAQQMMRIGVISDTHDLLRDSAKRALQGVEHILHVGDVCSPSILEELREIGPLTTVCGNMDRFMDLPFVEAVELGGCWIFMLHDLEHLDIDPAGRFQVVLHGHTHRPEILEKDGVLYFNPGSAGPRRGNLPVSLGYLDILDAKAEARWVKIEE